MPIFQPDAPDMRRPDGRQLQDLIDEARAALDVLEHGHEPEDVNPVKVLPAAELVQLARQRRTVTGLPSSTRGEGGPSSVLDDQNVPMPPLTDPVGELVAAALTDEGPTDVHVRAMLRYLRTAVTDLRSAAGSAAKATPAPAPSEKGDPGCKVHAAHGVWEPVYRSDRCRWDYEFWLANGVDTPATIVRARLEGKRITEAMVAQALNPAVHNKRRRKTIARALSRE